MKWPLVSRAALEIAEAQLVASREANRQVLEMWAAEANRHAALLEKYHALKLSGASLPEPERTIAPRVVDPIQAAINKASTGKDPKVRAAMWRQVEIDRKAGLKDDEIVVRVLAGNRPADDIALMSQLTSNPSGDASSS